MYVPDRGASAAYTLLSLHRSPCYVPRACHCVIIAIGNTEGRPSELLDSFVTCSAYPGLEAASIITESSMVKTDIR